MKTLHSKLEYCIKPITMLLKKLSFISTVVVYERCFIKWRYVILFQYFPDLDRLEKNKNLAKYLFSGYEIAYYDNGMLLSKCFLISFLASFHFPFRHSLYPTSSRSPSLPCALSSPPCIFSSFLSAIFVHPRVQPPFLYLFFCIFLSLLLFHLLFFFSFRFQV